MFEVWELKIKLQNMQKIGNCLSIYKGVQAWYRNCYPACTLFLYLDKFIIFSGGVIQGLWIVCEDFIERAHD